MRQLLGCAACSVVIWFALLAVVVLERLFGIIGVLLTIPSIFLVIFIVRGLWRFIVPADSVGQASKIILALIRILLTIAVGFVVFIRFQFLIAAVVVFVENYAIAQITYVAAFIGYVLLMIQVVKLMLAGLSDIPERLQKSQNYTPAPSWGNLSANDQAKKLDKMFGPPRTDT